MRAAAAAAARADGAGIVLRLPPLHARPKDDDQQQRDQAGEHARRHRRSRCSKRYVVDGQAFYYRNAQHPGRADQGRRAGLLPVQERREGAGSACRCRPASCASTRPTRRAACSSSARIASTTRRRTKTLNLKIGNAFDVVCERKQIDFEKIARNVYEVEYEITLRNHKAAPITVEVNEPIGGTWRMLRSSHQWTKTAAWAAQFAVPVAADGTAVLKYRVRVTY